MLNFSEWCEINEEKLNILWAETGADRKYDFDVERELEKEYEDYLKDCNAYLEYVLGQAKKYRIKGSWLHKIKEVYKHTKYLFEISFFNFGQAKKYRIKGSWLHKIKEVYKHTKYLFKISFFNFK